MKAYHLNIQSISLHYALSHTCICNFRVQLQGETFDFSWATLHKTSYYRQSKLRMKYDKPKYFLMITNEHQNIAQYLLGKGGKKKYHQTLMALTSYLA